ncbi:phenylalanine 4-monooxygenase [Streptomyces sp. NPDC002209]|uniref:phenylalanine 4-monooxygenase n=1 Tax=Streptomyces sp. NPDC002209 TaxID=3364638 RepID=UPI0036A4E8C5
MIQADRADARHASGHDPFVIDWMSLTPLDPVGLELGDACRHPGFADPVYLRRRNQITALAAGHMVGEPYEPVAYTPAEHATWRIAHAAVRTAQDVWACPEVLETREAALIPADGVPQHSEVSDVLQALTGFRFTLAGGIVPNKRFLGAMADGFFHAVQYVRHSALPLYTPEPDVLHDVFGHGVHLADRFFADLYRTVGRAAARVESADALDLISRVYWFTLEYGVVLAAGRPRAYGAALLSSSGELARFARADLRPWNLADLVRLPYQVAGYQPVLFTVASLAHLADVLHGFLDDFDEETGARHNLPVQADRGYLARPRAH